MVGVEITYVTNEDNLSVFTDIQDDMLDDYIAISANKMAIEFNEAQSVFRLVSRHIPNHFFAEFHGTYENHKKEAIPFLLLEGVKYLLNGEYTTSLVLHHQSNN